MAYGSMGGQREMVDVSSMGLTCADCGNAITELPFKPSSDRPVYCRDCNSKRRGTTGGGAGGRSFGGGGGGMGAPRQMVDVSAMGLTCASCGVSITELPFQPSADRPVYCRDCNRNRRG